MIRLFTISHNIRKWSKLFNNIFSLDIALNCSNHSHSKMDTIRMNSSYPFLNKARPAGPTRWIPMCTQVYASPKISRFVSSNAMNLLVTVVQQGRLQDHPWGRQCERRSGESTRYRVAIRIATSNSTIGYGSNWHRESSYPGYHAEGSCHEDELPHCCVERTGETRYAEQIRSWETCRGGPAVYWMVVEESSHHRFAASEMRETEGGGCL